MPPLPVRRQFAIGLFFSCCLVLISSVHGEAGAGNARTRSPRPPKVMSARTLNPLLKSRAEHLWEKGLAGVSSDSLENDEIVQALIEFVGRESSAERFSPALARAIAFLAEARQAEATEKLNSLLKSADFRIAMIAADQISVAENPDFLEPIMKLADRRDFPLHYGFRRCIVDAVARYRDKSAVDFLLAKLENSDGQLKYEIAISLQRTTGQEFGGIAADWRTWWHSNRDQFQFASSTSRARSVALKVAPKPIPWDDARPSFYGMTIYAKRVVFVIDRSGSMELAIDGETRLARAQQELQKAIQALSPTDYFNIVAFDERMEVFQSRLVSASGEHKKEGIRFAWGLDPRGATACYEPLKMGLAASNDLELILFLSDGEPTAGALVEPAAIVTAITNHNLTQRTTINTLGIDARDSHETFLKNLAEKNLGKLLLIR
jgi:hypothetical protein